MLKITIELHPGGRGELARTLAAMTVTNLSDLADVSDYDVVSAENANPLTGQPSKIGWHRVHGHLRRQSVWKLVGAAIAGLEGAEWTEV